MCPEIVMKREYLGPPTDIWATGILTYALLCGHFPFKGMSDKDLYRKIAKGLYNPPDCLSKEAKSFLGKILVVEPHHRASAASLLDDPWLRSVNQSEFLSTQESSTEGWKRFEEKLQQQHKHMKKLQ